MAINHYSWRASL